MNCSVDSRDLLNEARFFLFDHGNQGHNSEYQVRVLTGNLCRPYTLTGMTVETDIRLPGSNETPFTDRVISSRVSRQGTALHQ
jgi:hypothetical protein